MAEGTDGEVEEGISPSADAAPPKREEANEQTWRIPSTTAGRLGVSSTSVWFVFVKLLKRMSSVSLILMRWLRTNRHIVGRQTGTYLYMHT